jgi:UV DNA damage endonuclease
MTWSRYIQLNRDVRQLSERWLNNVRTTHKTIEHCYNNGWGYRVSSSLFPCATHPDFGYTIEQTPAWPQIKQVFEQIRRDNERWQVRLSTHPDQFNVLASDNQRAVDKSIIELNLHGWLLDQLGCDRSYFSPINIHVNRSKGDPATIASLFTANLGRCDDSVRSRLVVENEDNGIWNVQLLLEHFDLPVTFDNLHHCCNPSIGEREAMVGCAMSWRGVRPIFHYSEADLSSSNPRAHARCPVGVPVDFDCDWDVELKDKELAIRALVAAAGAPGAAPGGTAGCASLLGIVLNGK